MFYEENTPSGKISYDKALISGIVLHAVQIAAPDAAFPSDVKGRLLKTGRPARDKALGEDFIEAVFVDENIEISCYIIIKFGASISQTLKNIDDELRKTVRGVIGTELGTLKITVTGLLAKNLTKRKIRYVSHSDDSHELLEDDRE